jgi:hypothetical protein
MSLGLRGLSLPPASHTLLAGIAAVERVPTPSDNLRATDTACRRLSRRPAEHDADAHIFQMAPRPAATCGRAVASILPSRAEGLAADEASLHVPRGYQVNTLSPRLAKVGR